MKIQPTVTKGAPPEMKATEQVHELARHICHDYFNETYKYDPDLWCGGCQKKRFESIATYFKLIDGRLDRIEEIGREFNRQNIITKRRAFSFRRMARRVLVRALDALGGE